MIMRHRWNHGLAVPPLHETQGFNGEQRMRWLALPHRKQAVIVQATIVVSHRLSHGPHPLIPGHTDKWQGSGVGAGRAAGAAHE